MLMVDTVQVLPLSDVDRPEELASLMDSVSPKELSSALRMMVVSRYSVLLC